MDTAIMPEESYSIKEMIKEFRDDMGTRFDAVDLKVNTTNGRVKKLELREAYIKGALGIIGVMIVPILIFIAERWI